MHRMGRLVFIVFILVLSTLACRAASIPEEKVVAPTSPAPRLDAITTPIFIPPAADMVALQDTLVEIYQQVNPGVVALRALTSDGGSLGSGFVIDQDGHIITNYHVVEAVNSLEVTFASGHKTRGEILGTDLDSDIAVIKVDVPKEELYPLTLSDSDQVQVGQTVIAIGNPFGFSGTMTMGIVSGLSRTMLSLHEAPGGGMFSTGDIIQTDAAINPGNSGGPLLNLNGEVIGVNRAIFSTQTNELNQPVNSGIGFAVSINMVKRVYPALIAEGKFDYPYVGIASLSDLSLLQQETLGLSRSTGVYITEIVSGSPADQAGLRAGSRRTSIPGLLAGGDLIIAIDQKEVINFSDFLSYLLRNKSPGDTVAMTILREDKEIEIELTLEKRPSR